MHLMSPELFQYRSRYSLEISSPMIEDSLIGMTTSLDDAETSILFGSLLAKTGPSVNNELCSLPDDEKSWLMNIFKIP